MFLRFEFDRRSSRKDGANLAKFICVSGYKNYVRSGITVRL